MIVVREAEFDCEEVFEPHDAVRPTLTWSSPHATRRSARTVFDGERVRYVPDGLVHPTHRRRGLELARFSTGQESRLERQRDHASYRSPGFLSYEEKRMSASGLPRARPPGPAPDRRRTADGSRARPRRGHGNGGHRNGGHRNGGHGNGGHRNGGHGNGGHRNGGHRRGRPGGGGRFSRA
ncbi:hypothetical protein ABT263_33850 [Kitasatospora sp. NPDC001603]|uniref:hypothetical protein n=1 Tax=Kitasatospora sp. NPDC001603 TaxID=3154388 RepID=UPI0033173B2A